MIVEIRNRQRYKQLDTKLLKVITLDLLQEQLSLTEVELGIHLVSAPLMAQVNQQYLQHQGSTDVITFDHSLVPVTGSTVPTPVHGELFICVEDADAQATEFRTSWQEEVTRYIIHGILHLCGFDDLKPARRREMKKEEVRLLRRLSKSHDLARLGRPSKIKSSRRKTSS